MKIRNKQIDQNPVHGAVRRDFLVCAFFAGRRNIFAWSRYFFFGYLNLLTVYDEIVPKNY